MGNCISGRQAKVLRARIHPAQDLDPPAGPAPQSNRAEPGLGLPPRRSTAALPLRLATLADGPRLAIVAHLQNRRDVHGQAQNLHGMLKDLRSLACTSKTFREIIETPPSGSDVLSKARLASRLERAANVCLSQLNASDKQLALHFKACGPMLGLFTPEVRAEFVQQAIGVVDSYSRGKAIAELSVGMVDLQPSERAFLVEAAILTDTQSGDRGHLGRAVAVAGLLEGMNCLQAEHRASLILVAGAGIEAQDDRFRSITIAGLGKAIRHLPPQQREALVLYALDERHELDESARATALGGLGLAMAAEPSMNADGRIVEAALVLVDDRLKARAIADLAVGMGSMEPELRGRFFSAAVGFNGEDFNAEVAFKLGAAAEHLSDVERAELVRLATVPGAVVLNVANTSPEFSMCSRVCGLAAGMAHLTPEQCDSLSSTAQGFGNPANKAAAIGAMGQGLEHLSTEQHEQLVAAAIELGRASPGKMIKAITGLGAGVKRLNDDQRNRLIDALGAITDHPTVVARLGALSALTCAVSAMDWA